MEQPIKRDLGSLEGGSLFATPNSAVPGFSLASARETQAETPGVLRPTARPGLEGTCSTISRLATPSSRSQQAAEFSRSETARQIRASFENLVRASPSPQALMTATKGRPALQNRHLVPNLPLATPAQSSTPDPVLAKLLSQGVAFASPAPQQSVCIAPASRLGATMLHEAPSGVAGQPQSAAELLHGQAHALQKEIADGAGQRVDDSWRNGQHQASREGSGQAAEMDAVRSAACGGSISGAANVTPVAVTHTQEEASNAAPAATAGDAAERWGSAFPAFSVRQQGRPAVPQSLRPATLAAVDRRAISVDSDETDLSDDDRDADDGRQQSADRTPGAAAAPVGPAQATAEAAAAAAEEAGEAWEVEQQDAAQGKPTGRKTLAETVKQIQEERQPSSGQLQGFPSSNSDADVGSGCVQAGGAEGAPRPEERRFGSASVTGRSTGSLGRRSPSPSPSLNRSPEPAEHSGRAAACQQATQQDMPDAGGQPASDPQAQQAAKVEQPSASGPELALVTIVSQGRTDGLRCRAQQAHTNSELGMLGAEAILQDLGVADMERLESSLAGRAEPSESSLHEHSGRSDCQASGGLGMGEQLEREHSSAEPQVEGPPQELPASPAADDQEEGPEAGERDAALEAAAGEQQQAADGAVGAAAAMQPGDRMDPSTSDQHQQPPPGSLIYSEGQGEPSTGAQHQCLQVESRPDPLAVRPEEGHSLRRSQRRSAALQPADAALAATDARSPSVPAAEQPPELGRWTAAASQRRWSQRVRPTPSQPASLSARKQDMPGSWTVTKPRSTSTHASPSPRPELALVTRPQPDAVGRRSGRLSGLSAGPGLGGESGLDMLARAGAAVGDGTATEPLMAEDEQNETSAAETVVTASRGRSSRAAEADDPKEKVLGRSASKAGKGRSERASAAAAGLMIKALKRGKDGKSTPATAGNRKTPGSEVRTTRKRVAASSGQPRQPGSNGKAAAALTPQTAAVVTPSGKTPAAKARVQPLAEQPLLPEPIELAIGDSSRPRAWASAKDAVQQERPLPDNEATGARPLAEPASHFMPEAEQHAKPAKQPSAKLAASPAAKIAIKAEAQQQRPQTLQVSRTGRVRAPPVAFWANQSLRVDPKSGALHIHNEFEDQLVFVGQSSKAAQRPAAAHREPSVIKRIPHANQPKGGQAKGPSKKAKPGSSQQTKQHGPPAAKAPPRPQPAGQMNGMLGKHRQPKAAKPQPDQPAELAGSAIDLAVHAGRKPSGAQSLQVKPAAAKAQPKGPELRPEQPELHHHEARPEPSGEQGVSPNRGPSRKRKQAQIVRDSSDSEQTAGRPPKESRLDGKADQLAQPQQGLPDAAQAGRGRQPGSKPAGGKKPAKRARSEDSNCSLPAQKRRTAGKPATAREAGKGNVAPLGQTSKPCAECKRQRKGGCGTERAVRACLKRAATGLGADRPAAHQIQRKQTAAAQLAAPAAGRVESRQGSAKPQAAASKPAKAQAKAARNPPKKAGADAAQQLPAETGDADEHEDASDAEEEVEGGGDGGDGWTTPQLQALQAAWLKGVDPTAPGFWQRVAKLVPGGKTALDCHSKYMSQFGATPAPKPARARSGPAPGKSNLGGGNSKKPTKVAVRKMAREVRWQEREVVEGLAEDALDSPAATAPGLTLEETRERQEKADKYIDALLRRRGTKGRWVIGLGAGRAQPQAAANGNNRRATALVGQIADMVAENGPGEESDDAEEKDDYFSDASEE